MPQHLGVGVADYRPDNDSANEEWDGSDGDGYYGADQAARLWQRPEGMLIGWVLTVTLAALVATGAAGGACTGCILATAAPCCGRELKAAPAPPCCQASASALWLAGCLIGLSASLPQYHQAGHSVGTQLLHHAVHAALPLLLLRWWCCAAALCCTFAG